MAKIISGKFNSDVVRAVKKALESKEVNPLYIYGPSGSGKTFIIEKMLKVYRGNSQVVNAEKFASSELEEYLEYDLFALEDMELLKESSPVPETIFELISYYIENDKQIVLTSLYRPRRLNLPRRIISKIEAGVVVSIKQFDLKSRKKVIEKLGKDLPEKQIQKLIRKDIYTISQALGEIKKARVLGYVPLEEDTEETEEGTRSRDGEFNEFVEELREGFPEDIKYSKEEAKLREEYRSKMYVWKMKGFNTERIEKALEGPLERLTGEFVSFTTDVQRLIELQKRYGMLDKDKLMENSILSEEEINEIEKYLFDPEKVDYLNRRISELEEEERKIEMGEQITAEENVEKISEQERELKKENILKDLTMEFKDNSFRLIEEF